MRKTPFAPALALAFPFAALAHDPPPDEMPVKTLGVVTINSPQPTSPIYLAQSLRKKP